MISGLPRINLFQNDIFSKPAVKFIPLKDSALEKEVWAVLKNNYTIPRASVRNLQVPRDRLVNSQLIRVETTSQKLILKRIAGNKLDAAAQEKRLQWIHFLNQESQRNFPRLIHKRDHRFTASTQRYLWYLMHEEEGVEYPGRSQDALISTAHGIGRLFAKFKNACPKLTSFQRAYFTPSETTIFKKLAATKNLANFTPNLRQFWPSFYLEYRKTHAEYLARGWHQFPTRPCHIDLHPHNILLRQSKFVCCLDIESIQYGNRLACLGFAVFKLLRNYAALTKVSDAVLSKTRDRFVRALIETHALTKSEVPLLVLGARVENIKRFLHGFLGQRGPRFKEGERIAIFGRAMAGEIERVYA